MLKNRCPLLNSGKIPASASKFPSSFGGLMLWVSTSLSSPRPSISAPAAPASPHPILLKPNSLFSQPFPLHLLPQPAWFLTKLLRFPPVFCARNPPETFGSSAWNSFTLCPDPFLSSPLRPRDLLSP